jgi:hypothetical protein
MSSTSAVIPPVSVELISEAPGSIMMHSPLASLAIIQQLVANIGAINERTNTSFAPL